MWPRVDLSEWQLRVGAWFSHKGEHNLLCMSVNTLILSDCMQLK